MRQRLETAECERRVGKGLCWGESGLTKGCEVGGQTVGVMEWAGKLERAPPREEKRKSL